MTPERWLKVKELFGAALELTGTERDKYCVSQCGTDTELLNELRSLLAAHEQPGEFMDTMAAQAAGELLLSNPPATLSASNRIGDRVGAYRIVGILGTGGMGDVYKAVRDDDQYRAEVAIKLMRADMRNALVEHRFRTERQILAGLDHRNIARLLDGGTTANGMPYVVMELVNGKPIDVYCSHEQLNIRDRVQLFLQVCNAVSYAHQQLIVHRDLKPTNILVASDGSVKLLDFGIAKLLEADSIGQNTQQDETATSLRMMTLDYASPEQITGGVITTVSDVYSLGVVLYRLLTGHSPHGSNKSQPERVADILSDTTPAQPSSKIGDHGLRRELKGDLDNILMMALRTEPQQRYPSVEQFANDLRNYLDGMPVRARGNAFRYRAGKFIRRHKIEIASALMVVIALVTGTVISLHEAQTAERQRQIAQRHFDSVRKLSNKLFEFHDKIAELPGATEARAMLVNTSLEYLDALYKETNADPTLAEELGIAYRKVGDIQGNTNSGNTGNTAAALASYDKSITLLEKLYESNKSNHRVGAELARTYLRKSVTVTYTQGPQAAYPITLKTLDLAETNQDGFVDPLQRVRLLGNAYWMKANVDSSIGHGQDATTAVTRMIAVAEEYALPRTDDPVALSGLARSYSNASQLMIPNLSDEQSFIRTVDLLHKSEDANVRALSIKPDDASYQWALAETRLNIGNALCQHHRCANAIQPLQLAAPVLAQRAAADALDAHASMTSLMASDALAWAQFLTGDTVKAERSLRNNQPLLLELASRYDNLQVKFELACNYSQLGRVISLRARSTPALNEARVQLTHGLAAMRKLVAIVPDDKDLQSQLKDTTTWLAELDVKIKNTKGL